MNSNIALLAIVQIISSLSTGLFILWITYRGFQVFGKRFLGMQAETNLSYSIFMASVLFSVGFAMSSVVQPLTSVFRLLAQDNEDAMWLVGSFILHGGVYISIAFLTSIAVSISGVLIYVNLTPLNEFEEIRNNNIGVALVVSSIVIVLSLLSQSGIELLIESLLPYPKLPQIN